jgi:hypothetical protein
MTELRNHEGEIGLARRYPVSVLITASADSALAIANAIADENETGRSRLLLFDGADILDPANRRTWEGAGDDYEALVVREVNGLSEAEQAALMRLLETEADWGRRRIIATTSTCLFDQVQSGAFLEELFYRLNVIHIVGNSLSEGLGTSSRPIIAA